ncbi:hypothetical protein [Nocardia beijingensis]|uniref:hypothetical protein n=1 Tax=Nocardia beijingensis TaxID=95162 RepID=UPI001E282E57|nr:hypothetical protein [Nocardia beijingensis]
MRLHRVGSFAFPGGIVLNSTVDVRAWLRDNAAAIDSSDPDASGADLDTLIARLGAAGVVGLGESTRFSRQTFGVRERLFRGLVERHGFRALAIQDSVRSGERWDRFVTTGAGDPETVLAGAWRPWRTEESMARDAFDVLIHLRETTPLHWLSQVSDRLEQPPEYGTRDQ